MGVVTRFAPSNTGNLHIGGARTALFSWAYARKNGGQFLLRIEDTDKERSKPQFTDNIIHSLQWLGIDWDGDEIKQSSRPDLYRYFAKKLLADGSAYEKDGAVYLKVLAGSEFDDLVLGKISSDIRNEGDFVILKSDGNATFHLANVVDDEISGVTHVIRGSDHITNTLRHRYLIQMLGFRVPHYAHLPLICDMDGKPLSKRDEKQEVSVSDFRDNGYFPQPLLNFISLLGWSPPDNSLEKFNMEYLKQNFDFNRVGTTNSKFDRDKLKSFNSDYIRQMEDTAFNAQFFLWVAMINPKELVGLSGNKLSALAKAYKPRISTLREIIDSSHFINEHYLAMTNHDAYEKYIIGKKQDWAGLEIIREFVNELCPVENIDQWVMNHGTDGKSRKAIGQALRYALTGQAVSPPLSDVVKILGRDVASERIMKFLDSYKVLP